MAKILVIEDDPVLGKSLFFNLRAENYEPYWAQDLTQARAQLGREKFGLVIVDVNLPDGNGIEFTRAIRESGIDIPILILTVLNSEEAAVSGFGAGANDFIRKPYSVRELLSRVRMHLYGVHSAREIPTRQFEGLSVNFARGHLRCRSAEIPLSRMKLQILDRLIANGGRTVSRDEILQHLKKDGEADGRTIDAHISQLRRLFKTHKITHVRISSIYGTGYKLESLPEAPSTH